MGAAIPLSGRAAIDKGMKTSAYIKKVIGRFLLLWFFSYAYVLLNFNNLPGFWPRFVTILGFLALFPVYLVFDAESKRKLNKWIPVIRVAGFAVVILLIVAGHFLFGEEVNVQRRGIIIFLLAFLYLFGSMIWYFTRDRIKLRLCIFILLFLFTYVTKELGWPAITYANPGVRWWFNMEYIYFLLLLLPATYIGDLVYVRSRSGRDGGLQVRTDSSAGGAAGHLFFISAILFVVWLCFAFYRNITTVNLAVSVLYLSLATAFVCRRMTVYKEFIFLADFLLIAGILMIYPEGGIRKVPCTISYCLSTCSMSIFLLIASDYVCKYLPGSFFVKTCSGAGKNPLMSYIVFDNFVVPMMNITGFVFLYRAAYPPGYPLLGTLRTAVMVLFTMWCISLLTRRRIFWKA